MQRLAHHLTSLWAAWIRTTARQPHKIAVIEADSGRAIGCAELTDRATGLASADWHGQRIAFNLPNGIDWLATFLAIQKAGGIAVPLDPSLHGAALHQTVERLRATLLGHETPMHNAPGRRAASICCLKVTSGTSGNMTAIPCAPRHLLADGRQVCSTMKIRPRDRNLAIIPLGHSYGLGNLVMPLIQQATTVVCTSGLLPRHLVSTIEQHQVTVLPTVPAVLRALSLTHRIALPKSLRLVISAGAPLSAEVAQQFHLRFGMKIHNFYGSSETGGICFDRTGQATLTGRSVGKPMRGVTVTLARDRRVTVRSAAVAMPRGRHTLADVGEWTGQRELRLLGRVGSMANIGGRKVSPAEVETALRSLISISDAWVTVLQDRHGHDYLAAAIETTHRRAEIEQLLTAHLPSWKLPKRYVIAPVLPRNDRGKLDTIKLRTQFTSAVPQPKKDFRS